MQKVKGNAVLIDLESTEIHADEEYVSINDAGRKTGLLKIKQVKGNRAVATLIKGIAVVGERLELRPPPKSRFADEPQVTAKQSRKLRNAWGLILGYSMDSMAFTAADNNNPPQVTENVTLAGSTLKFKGFYDYNLTPRWTGRLYAGIDGFNGSYAGQSAAINKNGSTMSTLSANFLGADAEILWNFYRKNISTIWLGGGLSFQYAMSTSTNMYSLQLNSSYTNAVFFGTGANIQMSPKYFLPIFAHYTYYIAGAGISQTSINLGLGWGWTL